MSLERLSQPTTQRITMKVSPRHLFLLFTALIVRHYYLIEPLPSTLKVKPLSPSLEPKYSKLHYKNEQSLDKAVKLFQGRFYGAGIFLTSDVICISFTAPVFET